MSDAQAKHAMRLAYAELKLVLEPGGAVAFAALAGNWQKWRGETVVCILSGGNVDRTEYAQILKEEETVARETQDSTP